MQIDQLSCWKFIIHDLIQNLFLIWGRQDYLTNFEQIQSLDGVKTGDPREKIPDHPQAEHGLSHMWPD